jgi:hypothetical protein
MPKYASRINDKIPVAVLFFPLVQQVYLSKLLIINDRAKT